MPEADFIDADVAQHFQQLAELEKEFENVDVEIRRLPSPMPTRVFFVSE